MRHRFVRFVTTQIDADSHRRRGALGAAYDFVDSKRLPKADEDELRALHDWFEDHLEIPRRFSRSRRSGAAHKAISWFKSTARDHVRRMRELCRILNENGIATEMITSARPGYVVFEDEHQVAAVPFAETAT